MIRFTVSADRADTCDHATLHGITRDALLRSQEFRSWAEFHGYPEMLIVTPTEDYVSVDRTVICANSPDNATATTGGHVPRGRTVTNGDV